jgi:hypothetical protein
MFVHLIFISNQIWHEKIVKKIEKKTHWDFHLSDNWNRSRVLSAWTILAEVNSSNVNGLYSGAPVSCAWMSSG